MAFAALAPGLAAAADEAAAGGGAAEEVVVTGSRLARTNLETSVPVVSVGGADLVDKGITNLGDALNQLPQLGAAGFTNTNTNFADDGAGISTLNLRNLGESRTLVLVDGRRQVSGVAPGQGSQAVDVSTIPTFMIDHVDIVTGGGSSSYGSEAIAGVVNIVLKDHFTGLEMNEQYGLSTYGDNKTETIDIVGGSDFAHGKGHSVFAINFQDQGAVYSRSRDFAANDTTVTNGVPTYAPSSYSVDGRFLTDNGSFVTLGGNNIARYNSSYGFNREQVRTISIPTTRVSFENKTDYDLLDNVTWFLDARFARTTAEQQLEPIAIGPTTTIGFGGQTLVLPINNAFVPASLAAQGIVDDGNGNFADWRRRFVELGDRGGNTERYNYVIASGFKGELFGDFKWDASYQYGETKSYEHNNGGNVVNLQNALETTVINNQIVCADPNARAQGCVPVNVFGPGAISPAAINYIKAVKSYNDSDAQTLVDFNINGPVAKLPYGDLRVAAGFEYRQESGSNQPDALTAAGLSLDTQQPPTYGSYDVKDVYVEALAPILSDLPFVKQLDIEGSYRHSDYSTVGGQDSYRYGATYAPIEDVRFRAVNSVAIRAPNLTELYQGSAQSANSVTDPCSDVGIAGAPNPALRRTHCSTFPGVVPGFTENIANQQSEISYQSGNTNLNAERAKVLTYGAVIEPRYLPGFNASIDVYKIEIDHAIQSIDLQTAADECADTLAQEFCQLVRRDTNPGSVTYGLIQGVDSKLVNVGFQNERGIDIALNYARRVGDISKALLGDDWGNGRVTLGWNYEYLQEFKYNVLGSDVDQRGLFGAPKNRWNLDLGYADETIKFSWRIRYLGTQSYGLSAADGPVVKPFVYNDFNIRYNVTDTFAPYIGINNVFNVQPPLVDQLHQQTGAGVAVGVTGTNTVPNVYDAIGRYFYAGISARF